MKTHNDKRRLHLPKSNKQCKLHQQITAFCIELDKLPDASAVKDRQAQSAPLHLLPMVF